jgi:predicted PurR-regulated permease PerM
MCVTSGERRDFIEKLLILLLIGAVALVFWHLRFLLVLVFAAILLAIGFTALADLLQRYLPLGKRLALTVGIVILLGITGSVFWLFGQRVSGEAEQLTLAIPAAAEAVIVRLEPLGLDDELRRAFAQMPSQLVGAARIGTFASSLATAATDVLLVLVGGIYFAANPALYRVGLIKLVPAKGRGLTGQAMDDVGRALRLWLLGQLIAMALVGLLTGFGLWLIGVPSALTLGLLAGLLEFIPYLGPILSAGPALLLALAAGPEQALWTAALYVFVQQSENHLMQPLIQQRTVDIPPAVLLFGVIAAGIAFGVVGVIFAAPLAVAIYVLVKKLYVREALDTPTPLPGEGV